MENCDYLICMDANFKDEHIRQIQKHQDKSIRMIINSNKKMLESVEIINSI